MAVEVDKKPSTKMVRNSDSRGSPEKFHTYFISQPILNFAKFRNENELENNKTRLDSQGGLLRY